jgi:alkylation response protein AidB-like acyl-CoA dehydrogenase
MTASLWAELDPDELAWKSLCRRFAEEVMRTRYRQCDEENRFPREVHALAHEWGLMNVAIPHDLGGQGRSYRLIAIGGEELGCVCAPTAFTLGFNHGTLLPVLQAGTAEQKQVFVRDLLARREYASLCMTEPDASGSDLLGIRTRARPTDDGWVLDGTKCMTGVGTEASLYLVFAETELEGSRRGLSVFAVPRGNGVEVGPNTQKLGFRCVPTPTIRFREVRVPRENVIGPVGQAERILIRTLDFMRFGGVPVILGMVVGGLREILPWIEGRSVGHGESLVGKTNVQMTLGRIYSEVQMVRLLLWRVADSLDRGLPCGIETAITKYRASALAMESTQEFVRMMGWRGLDADYPAQKRLRDAMATSTFEGTNEVLQLHAFRDLRRQVHGGGDL